MVAILLNLTYKYINNIYKSFVMSGGARLVP